MTRKDYETIASAIYSTYPKYVNETDEISRTGKITQFTDIVNSLGDAFQKDNPRFDRQRFVEACYGI